LSWQHEAEGVAGSEHFEVDRLFFNFLFVVLKNSFGAMNSVPTNKSDHLSAKRGLLKVARESN